VGGIVVVYSQPDVGKGTKKVCREKGGHKKGGRKKK
jgi:hypothetical protein